MENFTISDLAQAVVLGLGAVSALLLVLWQSRCLCRCRLGISDQCYIFDCSREPPPPPVDGQEVEASEAAEDKGKGDVAKANEERDRTKGRRVLSKDRNTPQDVQRGTFPDTSSDEETITLTPPDNVP
tara:strand:- start:51 stop:434 length:384 start_codon:yes stop_codon:yes gene_type:complete